MLISELDLCKREWLELVFAGRNKTYGAYELRTRYNSIMLRAVAVTVFVVSAFAVTVNIISHLKPAEEIVTNVVLTPKDDVIKIPPKDKPKPPVELPKEAAAAKPAQPVSMQRYVPFRPVVDDQAETVEPIKENVAVGSKNVDTPNGNPAENVLDIPEGTPGGGGMGGITEDDGVKTIADIQVMPEPVGGPEAWAKFLQKNLRFPAMAQEQGVGGKVFLSFIIEKDGHLSDIKVVRKAGFGFDEEALRVLKLAPAWKPGIQNGAKVRVQYTIPINFQISNDN